MFVSEAKKKHPPESTGCRYGFWGRPSVPQEGWKLRPVRISFAPHNGLTEEFRLSQEAGRVIVALPFGPSLNRI